MKKFLLSLQFIFRPRYWMMNERYSKGHDTALLLLMEKYEPVYHDRFCIKFGDTQVWVANFPYAVGIYDLHDRSRPSRLTIKKLEKMIDKVTILKYS